MSSARPALRVSTRNARFQQWHSLLDNRTKRHRRGEFLVQGVRPITLAVRHGWTVNALLLDADRPVSAWAGGILESAPRAERVAMAPELLAELGERNEGPPELVAVVAARPQGLDFLGKRPDVLGVAFDRPSGPGNIGTVVRSADAFGADGLVVTGHAADPFDPKSVRASTGSLFALPTAQESVPGAVLEAARGRAAALGGPVTVVGTDEDGTADIADVDLIGPVLVVVGNEGTGMSRAWREGCDVVARIPIGGAASSLNAASAASVVLYEAARQRGRAATG